MFVALPDDKRFALGDKPLQPGRYTFQVQTWELLNKDYEDKLIFSVDISEGHISSLAATNCIIPFVQEIKEMRQGLHAN